MKVSVIYASTTGNTEAMANAVCESVKACGAEVVLARQTALILQLFQHVM